ncbi:MAG: lysophospholipase L1-like esterase [Vicingaceae bacterium]|jgi:lysophospholipase L1-like esterase
MKLVLKDWHKNFFIVVSSILLTLFVVEFSLRVLKPHDQFNSLPPNLDVVQYNRLYTCFSGLDSTFHLSINDLGYRSHSRFDAKRYGILTISESTTNCTGLSNNETWPWLLENKLNQFCQNQQYTVGNIAALGHHSGNHLLQLKYIEPQFENIRMVIIQAGVNDFRRFFISEQHYTPTRKDKKLFSKTFIQFPRKLGATWYQKPELWLTLRDALNNYKNKKISTKHVNIKEYTEKYIKASKRVDLKIKKYDSSQKTDQLVDLTDALQDFESNLNEITSIAQTRNIRLVFITQPTLRNSNMTGYEEKIASYSSPEINSKFLSPIAMEKGLDLFNQKLREISKKDKVELINLAMLLPKDTSVFFDDCHFNKSGSAKVANLIYSELEEILNNTTKLSSH